MPNVITSNFTELIRNIGSFPVVKSAWIQKKNCGIAKIVTALRIAKRNMRIDFVDAGKAALIGVACCGGILGLAELFAWLEEKYLNRIKEALKRKGWKK